MSSKNRRTGHNSEGDWTKKLESAFGLLRFRGIHPDTGEKVKEHQAELGTARQFSRNLDGRKIDVWVTPEHWLRKFWFQVKKTVARGVKSTSIDIQSLFEMRPPSDGFKVLVTQIKRKRGKNEMHQAWVTTLLSDDFLKLVKVYEIAQQQHAVIGHLLREDHIWDYDEHDENPFSESTREFHNECDDVHIAFSKLMSDTSDTITNS
jgi:hypothetical protein